MHLHILWTDLLQEIDAPEVLKQQQSLLSQLHEDEEDEIEKAIIEMGVNVKGENYPHAYEIVVTHEDIEKLRNVIEKNGTIIVYSGTGSDYKSLLSSIFTVITYMNTTEDVIGFLRKLAIEMYKVNQIAAKKIESIVGSIEWAYK